MAPLISTIQQKPEDILDFIVNQGHGVKGLAELGLKTLPQQYIHSTQDRLDMTNIEKSNMVDTIPVIDVSKWDDPSVTQAICDASHRWGFFQIVNHGVPNHVLEDLKDATHEFFSLPPQEKMKYSREHSVTKNVRLGTSFSPKAEKALEWKDYISLFYVSDDEASSLWPSVCRNQALNYMKSSHNVIKNLLKILMKGLNINKFDETKESILMGAMRINLNYYPKCQNPELAVGVGRHSDASTLTVLLQDDVGGLYVRNTETMKWIHVPPISGSLVINVGDALQIVSNGYYKSVEHHVPANGNSNRISVPIFVSPKAHDVIGALPELTKNGEAPLYKHIVYSDYAKHFFQKAHDGKATIEFVKI